LKHNFDLLQSRVSAEKFSGVGANGKKDRKIAKIEQKIALLSLYLLYLYDVWKFRGPRPPCCRRL